MRANIDRAFIKRATLSDENQRCVNDDKPHIKGQLVVPLVIKRVTQEVIDYVSVIIQFRFEPVTGNWNQLHFIVIG